MVMITLSTEYSLSYSNELLKFTLVQKLQLETMTWGCVIFCLDLDVEGCVDKELPILRLKFGTCLQN